MLDKSYYKKWSPKLLPGVKIVSLFDSDKPTPHFFTISTP